MKNMSIIILVFATSISIYGQSCKKMYKNQLEKGSALMDCEANYTIEKLKNGSCIIKRYYPETKMITQHVTFKNDKFKEKHGLFEERWDDGTLVNRGEYRNNLKEGIWILNIYKTGEFKNGKKIGLWKEMGKDSIVTQKEMYVDDALHGAQIEYDSLGNIIMEQYYEYGKLISTTFDTTIKVVEELPRFPGCEELNLSDEELEKCAKEKLLTFVYSTLKYPNRAREQNIQGMAMVQFSINEEGYLVDLKVLHGVSNDIKQEAINLIRRMPRWIPGKQNGEPVKVLYTLPISFKLN